MTTHISKGDTLILDEDIRKQAEAEDEALGRELAEEIGFEADAVDTTNATPETKDLLRSWFSSRG